MDLLDLLPVEHVVAPLRATDLRDGLLVLARRLEASGAVRDPEGLERLILDTPVGETLGRGARALLAGYRSQAVDQLALAVGVAPAPLSDPQADDPAGVIALLVAPPDAGALYLQTASTLRRLFGETGVVEALGEQTDAEALRALTALEGVRVQPDLLVRDVMAHSVHSVPPDATVRRTLDLMMRGSLHAVPVVDGDGSVLGMVTESDLMRVLLPQIPRGEGDAETGERPQERAVREIMTRSVLCVSDQLGLREVASMMINKDVQQLPVVDAGTIVGMVYRRDIIRKLFGP